VPIDDKVCPARYIIDRFDLWRGGAQSIYISTNNIKIETVHKKGISRPWQNY
jgi:hypothetical protein